MIKEVENKFFEFQILKADEKTCREKYKVRNMCFDGEYYKVRVISETAPNEDNVVCVKPDLEDLYLYKTDYF